MATTRRRVDYDRNFSRALTGFDRSSSILIDMADSVARLYQAVVAARTSDPTKSRTARLLRAGRAKMAKKLAEEAVEVVIDAMHGQPEAVVKESADLLYNLVVLWVHSGVRPDDVWNEMAGARRCLGLQKKSQNSSRKPLRGARLSR